MSDRIAYLRGAARMNAVAKLKSRVQRFVGGYGRRIDAFLKRHPLLNVIHAEEAIQKSKHQKGQWSRWYKANRRRQRQLSALKQYGVWIDPRRNSLRREDVP